MPEIWKDIIGYEGLYQVSNYVRIKSLYTNPPKTMKQVKSSTGYYHIQLYKNKRPETVAIHAIVARTFLGESNGNEINHIDGIKANNNLSNLEYVTRSENQLHAIHLGLRHKSPMTGKFGADSPTSRTILQYDLDGNFLKMWTGISETARSLGVGYSGISNCINGRNKSAYGYMWKSYTNGDIPQKIEPYKKRKNGVYPLDVKRNRKCKQISQYSADGTLIKVWESYKEIDKVYKNSNGNIFKCISGKAKTAYGYIWKYAE